jgi:hypothetical protein
MATRQKLREQLSIKTGFFPEDDTSLIRRNPSKKPRTRIFSFFWVTIYGYYEELKEMK